MIRLVSERSEPCGKCEYEYEYKYEYKYKLTHCFARPGAVLIDNPATLAGEMKYDSKIAHNNQTGKWLSTFHAVWHPNDSRYFACGSMKQPRCVEVLDRTKKGNAMVVATARGDYLSAVCSRVSFHPILPLLYGANSSGRVTRIDLVCE